MLFFVNSETKTYINSLSFNFTTKATFYFLFELGFLIVIGFHNFNIPQFLHLFTLTLFKILKNMTICKWLDLKYLI